MSHLKYLALGDSYTIGESVPMESNFPYQTAALLQKDNINVDIDIIAVTGWTTADLTAAIQAKKPEDHYSIVSLLIGVNNQYQGKSIEEYATEFNTLLHKAIHFAKGKGGHVFVLSIPDYSVTPFAEGRDRENIAKEIDDFNKVNKNISSKEGVHYIDITPISRQGKTDASMNAEDGLHPSAKQYAAWASLLAAMIKQAI